MLLSAELNSIIFAEWLIGFFGLINGTIHDSGGLKCGSKSISTTVFTLGACRTASAANWATSDFGNARIVTKTFAPVSRNNAAI